MNEDLATLALKISSEWSADGRRPRRTRQPIEVVEPTHSASCVGEVDGMAQTATATLAQARLQGH
jgi:hypothetical protein